jgi:hypothetical protein
MQHALHYSIRVARGLFAVGLCATALYTVACTDPAATAPDVAALGDKSSATGPMSLNANAALNRDLATLRASIARFHNWEYASTAGGYAGLFDGKCFENPGVGAMGLHYANGALVDANVELERPEAIMYEPGPGGTKVLVGVEYVVDPTAWRAQHAAGSLPTLFGRNFDYNATYNLYTLHVWTHKANPEGVFVGWNPKVSCQYWGAAKAAAHH